MQTRRLAIAFVLLVLAWPVTAPTVARGVVAAPVVSHGVASWYGWREHGRHMANGKRFKALGMTAASRTVPLGCWIVVEVVATGRTVRLRVTDRGPYTGGRLVDVSLGAARALGIVKQGLAQVTVTTVAC